VRSLVDDHTEFVERTLRSWGVSSGDVDDEVQRTFICACHHIERIRPGSERGYLFGVATRMAAHARRTYARRREILRDEAPEAPEATVTPETLAARKQMCDMFDRILDDMDDSLRSVFVLRALEDLRSKEAAVALGIPLGTAASRLRRARSELRARLARLGALPTTHSSRRPPSAAEPSAVISSTGRISGKSCRGAAPPLLCP
jgi:RNA polymerase sigma-70 factor, ECF subfamily